MSNDAVSVCREEFEGQIDRIMQEFQLWHVKGYAKHIWDELESRVHLYPGDITAIVNALLTDCDRKPRLKDWLNTFFKLKRSRKSDRYLERIEKDFESFDEYVAFTQWASQVRYRQMKSGIASNLPLPLAEFRRQRRAFVEDWCEKLELNRNDERMRIVLDRLFLRDASDEDVEDRIRYYQTKSKEV